MPRDEPDTTEEHQLHGEDGGSRDDALAAIQDAMRQLAARVDNLAANGGACGGPRTPTPPRGRMPAYDDGRSDAGRSDDGRSSASTMDPLNGSADGPVGPPDPLLARPRAQRLVRSAALHPPQEPGLPQLP